MSEDMSAVVAPEPIWKQRGFASEEAMGDELLSAKSDISKLKDKNRALEARAKKADEYEQAENARKEAELGEVERLSKQLADAQKVLAETQTQFQKAQREATIERVISSRMAGRSPGEAKLLRRLYDAEALKGFETEEELVKKLEVVDTDWEAERAPSPPDKQWKPPVAGNVVYPPNLDDSKVTPDSFARLQDLTKGPKARKDK